MYGFNVGCFDVIVNQQFIIVGLRFSKVGVGF